MNSTKADLLGILGLILGVLVIFFVLNYFNILSLSSLYPNLFGPLPHRTSKNNQIASIPEITTFTCPVDKNCNTGEVLSLAKAIPPYYGLGYEKLETGTKLLAIIPGEIAQGMSVGKTSSNNLITITNKTLGLEADYSFIGTSSAFLNGKKTANQKDEIGLLFGTPLTETSFQKKYVLIVYVRDLNTQKFLHLKPNFEQKIER